MKNEINRIPELSLFFPAYNEEKNIKNAIEQALRVLPKVAYQFEIIIVNDGSTDKTEQIASGIALKNNYVRVISQVKKGYGGAIKTGLRSCKYEWIFFSDSDLQFDLEEINKFIQLINGEDLIIGYRKNRAEGWKRVVLASLLRMWNAVFLFCPITIKDPDCAFKLLPKGLIQQISPLTSNGAMISTEIIVKAHLLGYPIKQIGVKHFPRVHGNPTGSNWKVIFKAVVETFQLQKHLVANYILKSPVVPTPLPQLSFKE